MSLPKPANPKTLKLVEKLNKYELVSVVDGEAVKPNLILKYQVPSSVFAHLPMEVEGTNKFDSFSVLSRLDTFQIGKDTTTDNRFHVMFNSGPRGTRNRLASMIQLVRVNLDNCSGEETIIKDDLLTSPPQVEELYPYQDVSLMLLVPKEDLMEDMADLDSVKRYSDHDKLLELNEIYSIPLVMIQRVQALWGLNPYQLNLDKLVKYQLSA